MLFSRGVADVGRDVGGDVVAVVVAGFVPGHGEDTDNGDGGCGGEDRGGPTDSRRAHAPPSAGFIARFGSSRPNRLATARMAGASVSAAATTMIKPTAEGNASDLK